MRRCKDQVPARIETRGCGTGALTSAICRSAEPRHVTARDTSGDFVDCCREKVSHPALRAVVASTGSLLPASGRLALAGRLRSALAGSPDGSIALTARAWAARGRGGAT